MAGAVTVQMIFSLFGEKFQRSKQILPCFQRFFHGKVAHFAVKQSGLAA